MTFPALVHATVRESLLLSLRLSCLRRSTFQPCNREDSRKYETQISVHPCFSLFIIKARFAETIDIINEIEWLSFKIRQEDRRSKASRWGKDQPRWISLRGRRRAASAGWRWARRLTSSWWPCTCACPRPAGSRPCTSTGAAAAPSRSCRSASTPSAARTRPGRRTPAITSASAFHVAASLGSYLVLKTLLSLLFSEWPWWI